MEPAQPKGAPPVPPEDETGPDPSQPLQNSRHERFAQNIACHGMSQTQAYLLAGYSATEETARRGASALMTKYDIAARVEFLKARTSALAIDGAALTKADALNLLLEQHQRNIGVRPVVVSRRVTEGPNKGKYELVERIVYSEHAASQTARMIGDEFGLFQGSSAVNGQASQLPTDMGRGELVEASARVLKNLQAVAKTRKAALDLSKQK